MAVATTRPDPISAILSKLMPLYGIPNWQVQAHPNSYMHTIATSVNGHLLSLTLLDLDSMDSDRLRYVLEHAAQQLQGARSRAPYNQTVQWNNSSSQPAPAKKADTGPQLEEY